MSKKILKPNIDFSKLLFIFSMLFMVFMYGFFSSFYRIFPYNLFRNAFRFAEKLKKEETGEKDWFYQKTTLTHNLQIYDSTRTATGVTLFPLINDNDSLAVRVIDMYGHVLHQWDIDWFNIWPNATHIPDEERPVSPPGTHVHGLVLLNDGSIIFNFEHLGLVKLDVCGNVLWKLPYRTHHSIFMDENQTLWIPGQINHTTTLEGYPSIRPLFIEPTILHVSLNGQVLKEIPLLPLFKDNDLEGLLYLSSLNNQKPRVYGDILHLNDVEIFPTTMQPGFFKPGDILLSFRNINTILVLDHDLTVKFQSTGEFIRQHDPDFVDGNTISVLDNNNRAPESFHPSSRILLIDAPTGNIHVYYTGTKDHPFFTRIMGNHQWLGNGNLLITESISGRIFEITSNGEIVWEYYNIVNPEYTGMVEEAHRLSNSFNKAFFERCIQKCQNE